MRHAFPVRRLLAIASGLAVLTGCASSTPLSTQDGPPPGARSSASAPSAASSAPASDEAAQVAPANDAIDVEDTTPAAAHATPAPAPAPKLYPFNDAFETHRSSAGSVASRYARLSGAQCRAETRRRKLPVESAGGAASGVATPMRITGPFHGVRFITPDKKTPYGKLDCRLALALDDLSSILADHQVTAVHVDSFYRPHAKLPNRRKPSQHAYGLAADLFAFTLADGRTLVVERDFHGELGSPVCGPDARVSESSEDGVALRDLVCAVARAGLFHHMLTPNFNTAHHNHLHFDVKRDDKQCAVD